jgi:hypothetical protein
MNGLSGIIVICRLASCQRALPVALQNNTLWSSHHHKVCIFLLCGVNFAAIACSLKTNLQRTIILSPCFCPLYGVRSPVWGRVPCMGGQVSERGPQMITCTSRSIVIRFVSSSIDYYSIDTIDYVPGIGNGSCAPNNTIYNNNTRVRTTTTTTDDVCHAHKYS